MLNVQNIICYCTIIVYTSHSRPIGKEKAKQKQQFYGRSWENLIIFCKNIFLKIKKFQAKPVDFDQKTANVTWLWQYSIKEEEKHLSGLLCTRRTGLFIYLFIFYHRLVEKQRSKYLNQKAKGNKRYLNPTKSENGAYERNPTWYQIYGYEHFLRKFLENYRVRKNSGYIKNLNLKKLKST